MDNNYDKIDMVSKVMQGFKENEIKKSLKEQLKTFLEQEDKVCGLDPSKITEKDHLMDDIVYRLYESFTNGTDVLTKDQALEATRKVVSYEYELTEEQKSRLTDNLISAFCLEEDKFYDELEEDEMEM